MDLGRTNRASLRLQGSSLPYQTRCDLDSNSQYHKTKMRFDKVDEYAFKYHRNPALNINCIRSSLGGFKGLTVKW